MQKNSASASSPMNQSNAVKKPVKTTSTAPAADAAKAPDAPKK
jgi:hypothetical protein